MKYIFIVLLMYHKAIELLSQLEAGNFALYLQTKILFLGTDWLIGYCIKVK